MIENTWIFLIHYVDIIVATKIAFSMYVAQRLFAEF